MDVVEGFKGAINAIHNGYFLFYSQHHVKCLVTTPFLPVYVLKALHRKYDAFSRINNSKVTQCKEHDFAHIGISKCFCDVVFANKKL